MMLQRQLWIIFFGICLALVFRPQIVLSLKLWDYIGNNSWKGSVVPLTLEEKKKTIQAVNRYLDLLWSHLPFQAEDVEPFLEGDVQAQPLGTFSALRISTRVLNPKTDRMEHIVFQIDRSDYSLICFKRIDHKENPAESEGENIGIQKARQLAMEIRDKLGDCPERCIANGYYLNMGIHFAWQRENIAGVSYMYSGITVGLDWRGYLKVFERGERVLPVCNDRPKISTDEAVQKARDALRMKREAVGKNRKDEEYVPCLNPYLVIIDPMDPEYNARAKGVKWKPEYRERKPQSRLVYSIQFGPGPKLGSFSDYCYWQLDYPLAVVVDAVTGKVPFVGPYLYDKYWPHKPPEKSDSPK